MKADTLKLKLMQQLDSASAGAGQQVAGGHCGMQQRRQQKLGLQSGIVRCPLCWSPQSTVTSLTAHLLRHRAADASAAKKAKDSAAVASAASTKSGVGFVQRERSEESELCNCALCGQLCESVCQLCEHVMLAHASYSDAACELPASSSSLSASPTLQTVNVDANVDANELLGALVRCLRLLIAERARADLACSDRALDRLAEAVAYYEADRSVVIKPERRPSAEEDGGAGASEKEENQEDEQQRQNSQFACFMCTKSFTCTNEYDAHLLEHAAEAPVEGAQLQDKQQQQHQRHPQQHQQRRRRQQQLPQIAPKTARLAPKDNGLSKKSGNQTTQAGGGMAEGTDESSCLSCSYCSRKFASRLQLDNHTYKQHLTGAQAVSESPNCRQLPCPICSLSYENVDALSVHMISHSS